MFITTPVRARFSATEGRFFEVPHGETTHLAVKVHHGSAGTAGFGRNKREESSGDDSLDEHVVLLSLIDYTALKLPKVFIILPIKLENLPNIYQ
jgi:hypothetical protein